MKKLNRRLVAVLAAAAAGALVGCSTGDYNEDLANEVRGDLSPELETMYERPTDIKNREALEIDENLRLLNEDLARIFLMDRSSLLADHPMPRCIITRARPFKACRPARFFHGPILTSGVRMDQSNTESRVRARLSRAPTPKPRSRAPHHAGVHAGVRVIISVATAEVLAINDARTPKHVHSCGRP